MANESIKPLVEVIGAFQDKIGGELGDIAQLSKALQDACSKIEQSWSGSYAGWHGRMYYRNFSKPSLDKRFNGEWGGIHGIPDGWHERDADEVAEHISKTVGDDFSVERFEERLKAARTTLEDFREDLGVEISLLDPGLVAKEKQIIDEFGKFSFGETKSEYIKRNLPGSMMTRDSEALRQGMCIPAWLYYSGLAYEGAEITEAFTQYRKQLERFVRRLSAKAGTGRSDGTARPAFYGIHPEVQDKCASLYEGGAYAEAVEKSFKIVRDRLRQLTGYETGTDAFGKGKLYIKGAAASHVDEDFNKAVQFLAMAIDRFRNEKSHTSDAKMTDPIRAYQYLTMSSLAMYLLEKSEVRP